MTADPPALPQQAHPPALTHAAGQLIANVLVRARLGLLGAVLLLATVLLWRAQGSPAALAGDPTVWVLIAVAFAVAEMQQFHVEVRRQTFTMSLSELPLIIGVVLLGVLPTIIARVIGSAVGMIVRRDPLLKAMFNLCLFSFEVALFSFIYHGLSDADISGYLSWLAVIIGISAVTIASFLILLLVFRFTQGWVSRTKMVLIAAPVIIVSLVNAIIAVIMLILLAANPASVLLLAVLGVVVVLGFRTYGRSVTQHKTLGQVYDFAKGIEQATTLSSSGYLVVEAVREELNAERAALWLSGSQGVPDRVAFAEVGGGDIVYPGPDDAADPLRERVLLQGTGQLFGARTGPASERGAVALRGAVQVIAVPLRSAEATIGYLEVCDRQGDKLSFGDEDVRMLESLATHVSAASQNVQLLRKLRHDALHDGLTGLPNRLALTEVVGELLAEIEDERDPRQVAVIVVDLGALAEVNDTLGHDAGDQLLAAISALLEDSVPEHSTVGRMGGDEFAVVVIVPDLEAAERLARGLRDRISGPCRVAGVSVEVNATLGLCVGPLHGSTAASLLQRADVALYAGHAVSQPVTSYQPEMEQSSLRRLHLATQLREAMLGDQIFAVFQPLCHLATSSIRSVETLVRWNHPKYGAVSPDDFIPLAEHTGMITSLTTHVLNLALRQCRSWLDQELRIAVAVNLSARTLGNPEFPDEVRRALADTGVPAQLLTLEITESSMMEDPAGALLILHELHNLGVRLAIDDFGTGYSSLAYLSRLPVDIVKIDKSFIQNIGTEINVSSITRAIIDLAHGLGLDVVAEGVEDELTRDLLTRMGCDTIQGYLVSRPLPGPRLDRWLTVRTATQPGERADGAGHPIFLQQGP